MTDASSTTFFPASGVLGAPLEHLRRLINAYPTLRDAEIISSECYTAPIRLGIVHRFLLLELRRHERKVIWVRFDRMRDRRESNWKFVRAGAQTRANDIVRATLISW